MEGLGGGHLSQTHMQHAALPALVLHTAARLRLQYRYRRGRLERSELGEGEGRAQGQDGDVIQQIDGVVLRMVRDPGDCPDVGGRVRGVMLPQRHLEIGA